MKQTFAFQNLVELCRRTHEEMRDRSARSVDGYLVVRNWLFGWYMVEYEQNGSDRAEYGTATLKQLSAALKTSIGRGFSVDSLELMRRFYLTYGHLIPQTTMSETTSRIFSPEISETTSRISEALKKSIPAFSQAVSGELLQQIKLSWSNYVILLTIDNPDERRFYEIEAAENSWSVRELERQVASSLYERLALSRDKEEIRRLSQKGHVVEKTADLIKNPFVLEFLGLEEKPTYSENELESAIIDRLETFLLELGKGFLFEARQKRFTFDNDHFYVDLVFYNRLLRCYVLIDLKRDKLTHQDLGQMQMYVNYFDHHVKLENELPTVGIVLCRRKNDALVELTLSSEANIFASKYQLYLPSKQELKAQVEKVRLKWNEEKTCRDEGRGAWERDKYSK
jgi:predicted nuclease of restriction endonuclease-like (RecB) superfamily